jgi:hypothetical protein
MHSLRTPRVYNSMAGSKGGKSLYGFCGCHWDMVDFPVFCDMFYPYVATNDISNPTQALNIKQKV